ncbi:MAG: DUF2934 domain-containing protein [Oligoflexia bacterium]|nr:DUF2934 domain-containing protein [Oligoflexia bacterium]
MAKITTKTNGKTTKPIAKTAAKPTSRTMTPEKRQQLIAEAAYFRAERRGFQNGSPQQDWIEAEAEINRLLNQ